MWAGVDRKAAIFVAWTALSSAWTVPVTVDLAWPPVGNEGYDTQNSQPVRPVAVDPKVFPCSPDPPSADQERIPFPVTGARLQYNLQNSTGQYANYQFLASEYFGHMDVDVLANKSAWAYITEEVFRDFASGHSCSDPVNATNALVTSALWTWSTYDLVGTNATLGVGITFFQGDENQEEMFQCSYITFVAADAPVPQQRGLCNSGASASTGGAGGAVATTIPSASSVAATSTGLTISATTATSATSAPTSTAFSTTTPPFTNALGQSHNDRTIGIAVGVSVAAALVIIGLGWWLLRRRRKHKGTIALDFFVRGRHDHQTEHELRDIKSDGKRPEVMPEGKESSRASKSGSINSQQLPSYKQALETDDKANLEDVKEKQIESAPSGADDSL